MGHAHGRNWTRQAIIEELNPIVELLGRMPSVNELKSLGKNDLSCAIIRSGGFKSWADNLGLQQKGTETHRGLYVQNLMVEWLRSRGFLVIEQAMRASFDLPVDGVRVDIKSARYSEYPVKNSTPWKGFVFGINKSIATCDLYILCGMNGEANQILWRYFIPADKARVKTITITPNGKYLEYLEAIDQIQRLSMAA